MVSVLDSEINLKVTCEELKNSGNWYKGWINLPYKKSITKEYFQNKSINKLKSINKVFVNEDSSFNIS